MCYEKNVETRRNFDAFALILLLRHQKYFISLGIFFQTYKFLITI